MSGFQLVSPFQPAGDQPKAIDQLTEGVIQEKKYQTLLGVTGSGKTFTMAHVIAKVNRPTLVISPNKTLAAQLYSEFKEFFPHNAVEYFVSYYDYYQPEAYIPTTDVYIEKDSSVNDDLDRLRLAATSALLARRDVIIVASVSCIYNLGSPQEYKELLLFLETGQETPRKEILRQLVTNRYDRNDTDFHRGTFRVRGEVVEIFPAYEEKALRLRFDGDRISKIEEIHPLTGDVLNILEKTAIYPATHFATSQDRAEEALVLIEQELISRLKDLNSQGKLLEAQRLEQRTRYDMEMLKEVGYCHGVENYSLHLSGRPTGSRPYCLIDYFPDDFLLIIDESHVTVPQIGGMYHGDRSRKETLVGYGFRLPSALDNRPLKFEEFESLMKQIVFISATPGPYELEKSKGEIVEQIIRPTGLVDPEIQVRPIEGQIDDLIKEIRQRAARKERILVTTLTKRMSEDLCRYLQDLRLRVKYLHSEIDAIERVQILRDLRLGKFDCLVGINLLREGLDLPEVSLVAVLDADKEGFLRSQTSLIQTSGRAARNLNGLVIFYADQVTGSMRRAMGESNRRRKIQLEYNKAHGITPRGIEKAIREGLVAEKKAEEVVVSAARESIEEYEVRTVISDLQREMELAARNLQFEKAAYYRDQIRKLEGDSPRMGTVPKRKKK
ncbi:MAG: excinuclease ABC subunit UvrB [Candidatus Omnitrophica bacterium]|nr:excinuclease ABC subunit UvrB [Candidatus Omnitrophota bacterium]